MTNVCTTGSVSRVVVLTFILLGLSVALPMIRLVWLFPSAKKSKDAYARFAATPSGAGVSIGQFNQLIADLAAQLSRQVWSSVLEVLFLGVGATVGAIAGALALTLS